MVVSRFAFSVGYPQRHTGLAYRSSAPGPSSSSSLTSLVIQHLPIEEVSCPFGTLNHPPPSTLNARHPIYYTLWDVLSWYVSGGVSSAQSSSPSPSPSKFGLRSISVVKAVPPPLSPSDVSSSLTEPSLYPSCHVLCTFDSPASAMSCLTDLQSHARSFEWLNSGGTASPSLVLPDSASSSEAPDDSVPSFFGVALVDVVTSSDDEHTGASLPSRPR